MNASGLRRIRARISEPDNPTRIISHGLGATGYIGAAVFDLLYAKHPEYRFTALVRSPSSSNELLDRYPLLRPVIGGLDNSALIEIESEKSNIVISNRPCKI